MDHLSDDQLEKEIQKKFDAIKQINNKQMKLNDVMTKLLSKPVFVKKNQPAIDVLEKKLHLCK